MVHRVATHVADHVLGIVQPAQLCVALRQPGTGNGVLHGLRLVELAHVAEGGSGLVEFAFLELRLTHQ